MQFKLIRLEFSADHELSNIEFRLFSTVLSVCDLRNFVDMLLKTYLIDKRNRLGNDLYYFDHHVPLERRKIGMMSGSSENIEEPASFTKNLFLTNRTLYNVFFEQREEVLNRVQFFMDRKDWYDKKGIPYTLGFMLYGAPGCGKTSAVKAIANMTQRHVINVNLGKIKTKSQLKDLFYSDRIEVLENSEVGANKQSYIIPIYQRLYVIEDIDCLSGDVLKKRDVERDVEGDENVDEDNPSSDPHGISLGGIMPSDTSGIWGGMASIDGGYAASSSIASLRGEKSLTGKKEKDKDDEKEIVGDLDLSSILNVMDGTLETPGRIIIITSNYPEKLDHAFIRPGRIDMIVEFKKASKQIVSEMFESFYDKKAPAEALDKINDYKWTPAEVGQILFKHFHDPDESLKDLANFDPKEYFKFSYFDQNEDEDQKENQSDIEDDEKYINLEQIENQSDIEDNEKYIDLEHDHSSIEDDNVSHLI